ncbi:hypothetical protein [Legionella pneumophila]|uniref:hypothetical protein n=1 Tax=Legionella pneumophila TaxID=446 RepID=UPI0007777282|nr:hypothetical protein [Legionella pneumophila]HAT8643607.1 hypothetical protein [Legionella pneumophila]
MNSQELKQAIANDIEVMKHMDVEIIPATEYYLSLLKLVVGGFWKLGVVSFLAILFACLHNPRYPLNGWEAYFNEITSSALIGFSMALGVIVLLFHALNYYYLIKYHLEKRLKLGKILITKLKQAAYLFWGLFALFCLMFASQAESFTGYLAVGSAFIVSAVITCLIISMELNRVGISALFTVVSQFINKGKTIKI